MNTVTRMACGSHAKNTLAFVLLAVCTLISTASFADPVATSKVTVRGTVSLAGLDVLTPDGLRIANWRIERMARSLCLQIVNMDDRDAAACVDNAVADARRELAAVIEARLAERNAGSLASASQH